MSYKIFLTDKFKKEAKRLVKKYSSLKAELQELNSAILLNPKLGTPLGNDTYKIRIAIKSKGKGKSGGARVISYLITEDEEIFLLTIYDKSELDSITDKALRQIIEDINQTRKK